MVIRQQVKLSAINAANALFINERYNLSSSDTNLDPELKEITKWRASRNLLSNQTFELKLKLENYNLDILNAILKPYDEASDFKDVLPFIENSEWFTIFNDSIRLLEEQEDVESITSIDWGMTIQNFILWIQKELSDFFNSLPSSFYENKEVLIKNLLESIAIELVQMIGKSAVLELNIAKLQGKLFGDTPEERFQSFIKLQFGSKENLIGFYTEYIVLARLLSMKSIYFVNNIKQAINHFHMDYATLNEHLDSIDKVVLIKPSMGDKHQKGKTVIEFQFKNTTLYYKPKNLDIASSYNNLVLWINKKSSLLEMPLYTVINRKDYSWEEQVKKKECKDAKQVENFYERFGQLIGIMYCLRGGDFHLENIIACGEFPVIIDLETLFQQSVPLVFPDRAEVVAKHDYTNSVIFTYLLPNRFYNDAKDNVGLDMSGLNGREQKIPFKILAPENTGTDEMVFEFQDVLLTSNNDNLAVLNGQPVNHSLYKEQIYKGFRNTCLFFMKNRLELTTKTNLLSAFKNKPVRVLLRATQKYSQMLEESLHPDYLRDSLQREQILENMWAYIFKNKVVAKYEIEDMLIGDIPIFFNTPNSKHIYDGNNNLVKDFFERSSYDLVLDRINHLDEAEIEKQLSWIKVSLGDYENRHMNSYKEYNSSDTLELNKIKLIEEARNIGHQILKDAYYSTDKKSIAWLDVIVGRNNKSTIDVLPVDFYDGISGLVLLYYYLYSLTDDSIFKDTYERLLYTLDNERMFVNTVSSFTGPTSILQALCRIPDSNPRIDKLIRQQISIIKNNMNLIVSYDYLIGTSGIINSLLHLYDMKKNTDILDLAFTLGEKLIEQLKKEKTENIHGGMSHGAAGISYILFRLNHYRNDTEFFKYALKMLERDREFFNQTEEGWIDGRESENTKYKHQWCHGSTGIGLSRALISQYYSDEFIDAESLIATSNIINSGYKLSDCLCHGNMGDIEFFLTINTKESTENYVRLLNQILEDKEKNHQFYVRHLPGFTGIGLFTGIAGIAYQLLRVAYPKEVPSVLY